MLKSNKHGRPETFAAEQAKMNSQARSTFMDRLVEHYSRTSAGAKLEETYAISRSKARHAAMALYNQENHLKELSETTIKTQFQTVPENVLRIVRIGTANSNRGEIWTEWPLVTPDDAIYFVDRTYAAPESTATSQFGGALRGGVPGTRLYETVAPNFATEMHTSNTAVGNGVTTTFAFTLSPNPVVPYSVKLIVGGALAGADNGAGGFSSTLLSAGTITYTSGAVSITFTTAPAAAVGIYLEYNWNSEVSTNYDEYAKVDLTISKKRFNARPMPLGYSYTRMVELTLGATGLGNVEDMLVRAVGDEHALRRDYKAVQFAKRSALKNPITTFNADFAAVGEVSNKSNAQRISQTISDISGDLYNDIKRGVINRIVCGTKALSYFRLHDQWKSDDKQARVGGTFYAGTLDGIQVYAVPADVGNGLLAANESILTYKNPDEDGDVAIAFGTLTELSAALSYPQFYTEGNIATVEDTIEINAKFNRLLVIANLP